MRKISYAGYRFPPEVINQAIWLYLRFTLSFRDVEDLLSERGIAVSYETVRRWVNHFGPMIAAHLRKRRPKPHATWHLDEVYLKIDGRMVYLWRAVDAEGEVLDVLVQSKRNKHSALKLMRKLLKKYAFVPERFVTDDLRSYGAAARALGLERLHERGRWTNNRAENSHQPTRRRERKMQRFKSARSAQKFLSTHAAVYNTFNVRSRPLEVPHSNPASRRRFDNVTTPYGTMLGDPQNKARGPGGRMSEAADAGAAGTSAAQKMADYGATMKAFQAQWESMLQAIGGPVAAGMIPIMKSMTSEFNALGAASIAHGDDIRKAMDAIVEPLKGLAGILMTIGPPIAKGAQELDDFLNSIVNFENKLGSTTHAFLKRWGIDFGEKGPLDLNAKPTAAGYDPLSSIRPPLATIRPTPSSVALGGGADNARLAAASAMPVNLPPQVNVAPPQVNVFAPNVSVTATLDGAAIAAAILKKVEAAVVSFVGGASHSDSGYDGRESPIYPDHVHGGH